LRGIPQSCHQPPTMSIHDTGSPRPRRVALTRILHTRLKRLTECMVGRGSCRAGVPSRKRFGRSVALLFRAAGASHLCRSKRPPGQKESSTKWRDPRATPKSICSSTFDKAEFILPALRLSMRVE
jgi:hypothetical protein